MRHDNNAANILSVFMLVCMIVMGFTLIDYALFPQTKAKYDAMISWNTMGDNFIGANLTTTVREDNVTNTTASFPWWYYIPLIGPAFYQVTAFVADVLIGPALWVFGAVIKAVTMLTFFMNFLFMLITLDFYCLAVLGFVGLIIKIPIWFMMAAVIIEEVKSVIGAVVSVI